MDSITFECDGTTIHLANGKAYFWIGGIDKKSDIVLDIKQLQDALSTAHMLIREGTK